MITHCPECGDKFDKPQPDDYICGACGLRLALQAAATANRPVIILKQSVDAVGDGITSPSHSQAEYC